MPIAQGILEIPYDRNPNSKHDRILQAVRRRWQLSRNRMSDRYTTWSEMEDEYAVYMPTKEIDAERKQKRKIQGEPQYTTIVVPYSYAQLLSAHTYWTSVFLSRTPIMQFAGRHGETEQSVQAIEAIIDYQVMVGQMLPALYIWLLDPGKYGFGVVGMYWDKEEAAVTQINDVPQTIAGIPIPGVTKRVRQTVMVPGYEGNKLYAVRPYDFFPDPRVPIGQFQQGEFCGRYVEVGWNHILKKQASGQYYNVDALKRTKPTYWSKQSGSARAETPNSRSNYDIYEAQQTDSSKSDAMSRLDYVELLEMHVELVPKEWELGSGEFPEKWVFTVGNDEVILSAQPLGYYHNKFPFHVMEYEIEGYSLFKRGMLEMLKPMNDVLTWLFNTHFYNVRKILNGNYVVDPSKVVMSDFEKEKPGLMVRLKPNFYGTDVRTVVNQLEAVDVTQTHIRDAMFVMEMMQRMVGVTDNIMGQVNPGGRKTATEVRSSNTMGINRLKTGAEYFSACGFTPLGQMLLQNTQQKYDAAQNYKIAGKLLQNAERFVRVTPDMIAGFYDFVPVDGTLPIDRFAQAAIWRDILTQIAQIPEIMVQYDLGAIFGYVAHMAGVKNLNEFRVQLEPNERIAQLATMGDLVPVGGKGGRNGQRPPGGGPGRGTAPNKSGAPPLARQVAGMGET